MPTSPAKYILEIYRQHKNDDFKPPVFDLKGTIGRLSNNLTAIPGDESKTLVFQRAFALPYVQSYGTPRTEATMLRWTFGKNPIIEHSGIREGMVRISGRSGIRHRLGHDRTGGAFFASGKDIFAELRAFLAEFQNEAARLESAHKGTLVMIIRALWEGDDLKVEPISFDPSRSVKSSRFSWEYSLLLRSYGEATKPQLNLLGRAQQLAKSAARAVDQVSIYLAFANQYTQEIDRTARAYLEPVHAVGRLMQQATQLNQSAAQLTRIPADTMEAIFHVADEALRAIQTTIETFPFSERINHRPAFYDAYSAIGEARNVVLEFFGQRRARIPSGQHDVTYGTVAATGKTTDTSALLGVYQVIQGDTLTLIATKLGVSPAQIIDLNGMTDAQTLNDGSPFAAGAVIIVPVDDGVSLPSASVQGYDDIFGADVLQDEDGDWTLNSDTAPDDVVLVRGRPLLKQALRNRMRTEQGEHGVFPEYGIIRLVGERAGTETAGILASHARTQLLRDPRIKRVVRVTVEDRGAAFVADAEAIPRVGPGIVLSVPVSG